MSRIISVTNQKGGVGKTTTSVNLSAYLAKLGQRVLLVDLDPQANTTAGLGFDKGKIKDSLYDVLVDDLPIDGIVLKTRIDGLSLLPANPVLAAAEIELVKVSERERRLQFALDAVKSSYDLVIIDSPPSLGLLTVNGLTASDHVLIPVQSEYYSLEGLSQLIHTVRLVRAKLNPQLDIIGVLATMFDKRTMLAYQVYNELKNHFSDKMFETVVPRNVRLAEAPSFGKTIHEYDRFSRGAASYKNLAKEVLERVRVPETVEQGEVR